MSADDEKRLAAYAAADLVEDGMIVGLGTGSTAAHAVKALGERVARGLRITGVPTSRATEELAQGFAIPLAELDQVPRIDLTIDGADEIDPQLNMIKGGGAALLREKLVASASTRMAVIVDSSKFVACLGQFALPIEVVSFGAATTARRVALIAAEFGLKPGHLVQRRTKSGEPLITDQGNHIYDARFEIIPDAYGLAKALDRITGVVEHGLFLDLATQLFIGRGTSVDVHAKGDLA